MSEVPLGEHSGRVPTNAWQKGTSANPRGRTPGWSILQPWKDTLAAHPDEKGQGERARGLGETLTRSLEQGNAEHAKIILDAIKVLEPQPKQIELSTPQEIDDGTDDEPGESP
jgi:hypothetical protein